MRAIPCESLRHWDRGGKAFDFLDIVHVAALYEREVVLIAILGSELSKESNLRVAAMLSLASGLCAVSAGLEAGQKPILRVMG